jgi:hypothetical protein
MKYLYALILVVLVSACAPVSPTGNIISSATNAGDVLITYSVYEDSTPLATRVNVRGDIVAKEFFVDGQRYELSGPEQSDEWISGTGTAVLRLDRGTYRVVGISCVDDVFSSDCTRIGRNIRI